MESLQALVQACDLILKQPSVTQEALAQDFLDKHPLEAVFRYVYQDSTSKHKQQQEHQQLTEPN
jgi:hypothetical protein